MATSPSSSGCERLPVSPSGNINNMPWHVFMPLYKQQLGSHRAVRGQGEILFEKAWGFSPPRISTVSIIKLCDCSVNYYTRE